MIGTILLLFLIFFIIIPAIRIIYRIWTLNREIRQARQKMSDAFGGQYGQGTHRQQQQPQPQKKKKIDPEIGEFVSFEDIRCDSTDTTITSDDSKTYTPESQVEDAIWEDIKQ